jgi:tetratricopeptide (TPR) repeat protein
VAVVLLGLAAYANSLHGAFVFDDLEQIVENPALRDLGSFLGPAGYRFLPNRFVAYVTFALNHAVGGLDPVGWHVVNLAIHLANALLVWAFVRLAFRSPRLRGSALAPSAGAVAFVAAALFVSHPLATQAVSYVVQRLTSLAALFYLSAVVLYLRWRLGAGRRIGGVLYAGVLVAALLAMRTKEIAFTLPVALALVEWALLEGGRRRWLAILPVLLVSLLIPLTLVDLGKPASAVLASADASTRVLAPAGRMDYLRTQAVVVASYLRLLALPVGQTVDHEVAIRRSWLAPDVLGATLLLAALVALAGWLAWRSRPRNGRAPLDPAVRLVALGIAWFFAGLAVESSIIPIADVMNEHRVYLPAMGLLPAVATAAGLLLLRLDARHVARDLVVAGGLLSLVLAVATWNRNRAWADEIALWSDAAAKAPGRYRPFFNWGAALTKEKRFGEAAVVLRRGVEIDPASVAARIQLGVVLYLAGDPRGAEVELRRAVALDPSDADALLNLAVFLSATERRPEARLYLERLRQVARDPADRAWAEAELAK